MDKQAEFFRRYDAGENTYNICQELKIPFYVSFMWIKKTGREVRENAISTLSETQKVGYFGEKLFKKYAQKALNVNKYAKVNNPKWDFEIDWLKIDVKTSRPKWNTNGVASWKFNHLKDRRPDLVYVLFLLPDNQEEPIGLDEIDEREVGCLFIPSELIAEEKKAFVFHEVFGYEKYGDFLIELSEIEQNIDLILQAV